MNSQKSRREHGFTLIELMIVLFILAVIAVIAVPNLLSSKKVAVETKCIGLLKSMVTVNEQYSLRFGGFTDDPTNWIGAGYFPDYAGSSYLPEYSFSYSGSRYVWSARMDPNDPGITADRYFYADSSGVIRWSTTGTATSADPPID